MSHEPRPETEDGPVRLDPKASAARIIEGLSRDPEQVRAASKVARTDAFISLVRSDLAGYIERSGATQADVARAIGSNPAYVNQFLSGKFPVPKQEPAFARTISRYLAREGRRADQVTEAEFVETRPARHTLAVLQDAHDGHRMVADVGRSGMGKTISCRHYAETNEGVIYVLCGYQIRAPRAFLGHLAGKLKMAAHARFADLYEQVVVKLANSGRLLIVDEAEHLDGELGEKTMEMLRQLWERTAIGLAFVSNERFWRNLENDRTAERMEKFTTRLGAKKFLRRKAHRQDVEAIVARHLESYDAEVLERLVARAQGPGAFRAVALYCQQAAIEAAKDGGRVTMTTLDRVAAVVDAQLEDAEK
jgi:DNA transposition AAA+ family ATPase